MRFRLWVPLILLTLAGPALAVDRWILIAGTVGAFHTDARIVNPSFDKDITVNATFLPRRNADNSGRTSVSFIIPRRQMKIINDVTSELFATTDLGAIRFSSEDEFEVTSRIYALTPTNFCPSPGGTLGQFGPGLATSAAKAKGALLQLKVSSAFRTNMGALNPNTTPVTVTWTLYGADSSVAATGSTTLQPLGVLDPLSLNGGFFFTPATASLSDAWLSFSTDGMPIFAYASVVDNNTTDQTFIVAVDDKGTAPPPGPKNFTVTLEDFSITFSPAPTGLRVGDQVTLRIVNRGPAPHGFFLIQPNEAFVVPSTYPDIGGEVQRSFTIQQPGLHTYFCANGSCGKGHSFMTGTFTVSP